MKSSIKQIFLEDIEESLQTYAENIALNKEPINSLKQSISIYLEVEKRLSHSVEDESLRQYINRRVKNWHALIEEYTKELFEAEETRTILESIKPIVSKRKEDMSN